MASASDSSDRQDRRVAVVLSGAVARGAFQAGALGQVLSSLPPDWQPSIILGSSAGAINAVLWAVHLDDDAAVTAEQVNATWRRMSSRDVYAGVGLKGLPGAFRDVVLPAFRGAIAGRGDGIRSLLDTKPLSDVVAKEFAAPLTLSAGLLGTVGVVATWMPLGQSGSAGGRSVLFLQERSPGTWAGSTKRALDVERTTLLPAHVLASCAVPAAFPAQPVPGSRPGWYVDGGVRLNTPIKAAVGLGATHVIVVSAMSMTYADRVHPVPMPQPPDVADAASHVMHAVLADRAVEDLLAVEKMNWLVAQAEAQGAVLPRRGSEGNQVRAGTDGDYRRVSVMAVAPKPGELGSLADDAWRARYGCAFSPRGLQENAALGRALRSVGDGQGRSELLSYVLFDEQYFAESIAHGAERARSAFERGWQTTQIVGPWLE